MKKLLLPFALLAATLPAAACINAESRALKDGSLLYEDRYLPDRDLPHGHEILLADFDRAAGRLRQQFDRTHNYDYLSDLGVVLIYQKKYTEARDLYRRIEREKPGRYATASNLGTVYELLGRNDSALYWIRRAVAINPGSHGGSEFIHVNILEAKVAGKSAPSSEDLLDTGFGNAARPAAPAGAKPLYVLREALFFQLNERMTFIKPEDPIIARLLFDLGNVAFLQNDPGVAAEAYEAARRYGFRAPLLEQRRALLPANNNGGGATDTAAAAAERPATVAATQAPAPRARFGLYGVIGAGFVLLAVFVGALFRRRAKD